MTKNSKSLTSQVAFKINTLLLVGALALGACSSRAHLQLDSLPSAEAPSRTALAQTKGLIDANLSSKMGFSLTSDGAMQARAQKIVDRLVKAAGGQGFSYPVYIAQAGEQVNAMAVNSNTIVVYRKLMEKLKDDNELAAVLAHEIGHILAKHSTDKTSSSRSSFISVASTLLGAAVQIAAASSGTSAAGFSRTLGGLARGTTHIMGEAALVRPYDRDMEYEADQIGLVLMAKAGYNPQAAIKLWGRAKEIFGADGGSFLSTHPSNSDRAEELQKAMPTALKYYSPSPKLKRS